MNTKTRKKAVISALTTIVGLSGLIITPSIEAHNHDQAKLAAFSDQQNTSPTKNSTIAKNSTDPIQEFLSSKLYQHQWQNQQAVTLRFQNIPVISFLGESENNIVTRANQLAIRLEELYQQQADASLITVSWNAENQDYTIKFKQEELVSINKTTVLPDTTNNLEVDALQATNRLRRLLGNAAPLKEVEGKPKPQVKTTTKPNQVATAGTKNRSKGYQGIASWYGPGFHGRKTASGERFNQNALTAAHRSLAFGTRVKVTNLRNGNSVVVRINDRGPHVRGRIIDLSASAARIIGVAKSGVAPVRLQVLGR